MITRAMRYGDPCHARSYALQLGTVAALAALLLASGGCTTTLVPPADVREPVSVFLLDHGRTPSLVLPAADGGMIRYAYGDWQWYALRRTGALNAIPALLWPTRGTLGRGELAGPADDASIRRQVHVGIEHLYEIRVESEAVQRLRETLDGIYHENLDTLIVTESVGLSFTHHPQSYCALHNSNHVVADWLRQLGVQTRGITCVSTWRVR